MTDGELVIGVDFGTLSARAVVVDPSNGEVLGDSVAAYPHDVVSRGIVGSGVVLPPDWALQVPADFGESLVRYNSDRGSRSRIAAHERVIIDENIAFDASVGVAVAYTAPNTVTSGPCGVPSR